MGVVFRHKADHLRRMAQGADHAVEFSGNAIQFGHLIMRCECFGVAVLGPNLARMIGKSSNTAPHIEKDHHDAGRHEQIDDNRQPHFRRLPVGASDSCPQKLRSGGRSNDHPASG